MEQSEKQDVKNGNRKVNYHDKNIEYLERMRARKQKEQQQRTIQQKKQQQRRSILKKKILQEATKNRESKNQTSNQNAQMQGFQQKKRKIESLPKQIHTSSFPQQVQKKDYLERHTHFLQNLHHNIKSKKQVEEQEKIKKQQKYLKMKQQLGLDKVQSKIGNFKVKKADKQDLFRTHSAQKFDSMIDAVEAQLPRTNKNFSKKNQEYLEKIRKKRELEIQFKEEEKQKKQKLKDKLKDYVMTTMKNKVLEGAFEEDLEKKDRTKKMSRDMQEQQKLENQDSEDEKQVKTKKKKKLRSFPHIVDLAEWKKKNRLDENDKIFIITGGYGELKKSLKQRGWYQNPDPFSPCFNLKYTLQAREIQYDKLIDFQMANHFQKVGCITTKIGLAKTLRNLVWIKDISQDHFFPKCFDLNDDQDYTSFQTEFKISKAVSILKIYSSFSKSKRSENQKNEKLQNLIEDLKLRTQIAINVCKKNIEQLDDIIDRKKQIKTVTQKQWEILAQDQLNEAGLAKKKHQQWLKSIDFRFDIQNSKPVQEKKKKKKKKKSADEKDMINFDEEEHDELFEQVERILQIYEKKYPQFHLTGHDNIWILKPAGLSRGRGITCYNNLVQIQDHVKCKESQWIAQKYIQNPLVVLKRKFDIRQWVLVTDFNPLTIWLYDECYVRFSASDYNAKQVNNRFIHLTNNAIGSKSKKVENSHIKGNMFFQHEFAQYLQQKQGYQVFEQKIKPQIKQIIKYSLMCAVQHVQNRKNTHELFGYDLMVDQNYKVWLIEINSSPSMDYSTHVTSKLVKECLHDIVKVIVDFGSVAKKERKNVDTGKFRKIYRGIQVSEKVANPGLQLCLEGIPVKKPKKNVVRVTNFTLDQNKKLK